MAMRIVVGDEDTPDYEDTFEAEPPLLAPFSKRFLEFELNEFSDHNEGCDWPWLTPVELLDADVLDPDEILAAGSVSFASVLEELDRFDVPPTTSDSDCCDSLPPRSHNSWASARESTVHVRWSQKQSQQSL
ncbi:hypothetical protein BRC83_05515 [Halobacteriales archaeon QS_1_68_17]|nr:MAG: hypothetical protein BRC83_05515 [Halobacteriales archaeon QS_1_68_17]